MKSYLLGIDNGGTVCKAALFDLTGKQIYKASIQVPLLTPKAGHTERDMTEIWRANAHIIRQITAVCDGEIIAVGLSGHGKGLYVLGESDTVIYNGIGSTDRRALEYELRWMDDGTAQKAYEKTVQKVLACQPVCLLRWMKDHDREVYDHIRWVLSAKDYVRFCLTGEIYAEYTDVSGTNLLNLHTRKYDPELLKLFGIEEIEGKLPPIKVSTDICGFVTTRTAEETGLPEGVPVMGGMFDIDACAVAMGSVNPYDMCVIAGTWSINEYVSPRLLTTHAVSMNSLFCDPDLYLAEESSAASAGNLEWVRELLDNAGYSEIDKLVETASPQDSVYYLPFLYGSNEHPYGKASLIGLSGHHTRAHVLRAVYEGVAFSHQTHLRRLLADRPPSSSLRLAGGVTNSSVWVQIFADVFQIPVQIVRDTELGAKGAAMAAGIGIGIFRNYAQAVEQCVSAGEIIYPGPNADVYRKKYETYRRIVDALDGTWPYLEENNHA